MMKHTIAKNQVEILLWKILGGSCKLHRPAPIDSRATASDSSDASSPMTCSAWRISSSNGRGIPVPQPKSITRLGAIFCSARRYDNYFSLERAKYSREAPAIFSHGLNSAS